MIIDAHQHFWQLSREHYDWPNESVEAIFRDFSPDDLQPLLHQAGVSRTVVVQALDTIEETRYLLEIAQKYSFVAGVVGWVDLSAANAVARIDELRGDPLLKGLRPMLQNIEETEWILHQENTAALEHMAKTGLRFDALIQPRHLKAIDELAARYPGLPIVIDHIAKPAMGDGRKPDPAWSEGMKAIAAHENCYCKLSGMVTEIGPDWQLDDLRAHADTVIDCFSPERVMFGSDWPVLNLAGDYLGWLNTVRTLIGNLSESEQEAILSRTAIRFYDLAV